MASTAFPTRDDLSAMFRKRITRGEVRALKAASSKAPVTGNRNDMACHRCRLKSEGPVSAREFARSPSKSALSQIGDESKSMSNRIENVNGEACFPADRRPAAKRSLGQA